MSHETLYRLIGKDRKQGSNLYTPMRHRRKHYLTRGAKNLGRGYIPGRGDIAERPQAVQEKVRLGDGGAATWLSGLKAQALFC